MQYQLELINRIGSMGLMDVMEKGVEKYFLLYRDTDKPRWYDKFLQPGFQHVSVLFYDGFFWHSLEQDWSGISMRLVVTLEGIAFNQMQDITKYYKAAGFTVQEVKKRQDENKTRVPFLFAPQTCTEVAKAFIGLRKWWLFTPYALFNFLSTGE